ncbi:MAG: winged helix-turn-helix transcriptional regulator [Candidatus Methanomethylophilaceae archaeon]|nr:winged helix-turn-helix transcriptional regulator [Candidatus Methanomethylophilaceae archaeon]
MFQDTQSASGNDNMSGHTLPHDHGDIKDMEEFSKLLEQTKGFDTVCRALAQMSDGTRMRIFWLLCHYEGCVTNISAIMGMSSPAVSHHLRSLRESGLIESRRVGKEVYYKAVDSTEVRYLHHMIEDLMELTCPKA